MEETIRKFCAELCYILVFLIGKRKLEISKLKSSVKKDK